MAAEGRSGERGGAEGSATGGARVPRTAEIVEYTDPACPWSWGSEPVFRALRARTRGRVRWRRVFGILFDEDDDAAPDPAAEAAWYVQYIARTARHTHAPFTNGLRRLTSSSWPAALAAKAAERQGPLVGERVLRRLRETTFLAGVPADTVDGAVSAAEGVPGLDAGLLRAAMAQRATLDAVREGRRETRAPLPQARAVRATGPHGEGVKELADAVRYSFPTLLFRGPGGGSVVVPGWHGIEEYEPGLAEVTGAAGELPPLQALGAAEALERYRSMTGPDWDLLAGGAAPPAHAVRVETGNGPLWLHPGEVEGEDEGARARSGG